MQATKEKDETSKEFKYIIDEFADIKVMRYRFDAWNFLSLKQKHLIYHLSETALWGRDIIWQQNCKYNLPIRKVLEDVLMNYSGDRTNKQWQEFEVYCKRVFFSNGIHHHYGEEKFFPLCSKEYFIELLEQSIKNSEKAKHIEEIADWVFNPCIAPKRKETDKSKDIVAESAVGFYSGVSRKEVEEYYSEFVQSDKERPLSVGINSVMVKSENGLEEKVCKSGGVYGRTIDKIVENLRKALPYCENEKQKRHTELLISYYTTGDLKTWDDYNIEWVEENEAEVDYISGFIETYLDPLGRKASWEALVDVRDGEATKRCELLSRNAQWFEDNCPINPLYKKTEVKGISAKVVDALCLAGDNFPTPPIGINLPNSDWIRKEHGSKSVNIANLAHAYENAAMEKPQSVLAEFAYTEEEKLRAKEYSTLSNDLHTDMHECLGHGSGKLLPQTDQNALREYSSTLEEARADLFALYFMFDDKMIELGLIPNFEVAKEAYDSYIRNGLLTQLTRIEEGKDLTEAHMQARKLIAEYAYENSEAVARKTENGKTYFSITDYKALRKVFGELLAIIQNIKSTGNYAKGKDLVEKYGVKIDKELHKEVIERYRKLDLRAYGGFVNLEMEAIRNGKGEITDYKLQYPESFLSQMLHYGKTYSFD